MLEVEFSLIRIFLYSGTDYVVNLPQTIITCSKLTIETLERRPSGNFIEHTLNIFHTLF